jgi:hypothetical protein
MRTEGSAPPFRLPAVTDHGVLFLYGAKLGIRVRYGSLAIDLGRDRTLTLYRASQPRLRRLVVAGHGWWSFEVPRWLFDVGASWIQLDLTGRVLGSGPGTISPDLPALRRAQALAAGTDVGLEIGRWLLTLKLQQQGAALAARHRGHVRFDLGSHPTAGRMLDARGAPLCRGEGGDPVLDRPRRTACRVRPG